MPKCKANDKNYNQVYFCILLPGSSTPIKRNVSISTSQIITLVEDSNAEKGKIKNWMMVLFLRKVSDADDMTFLYIL